MPFNTHVLYIGDWTLREMARNDVCNELFSGHSLLMQGWIPGWWERSHTAALSGMASASVMKAQMMATVHG